MSVVLARNWGNNSVFKRETALRSGNFSVRRKSGKTKQKAQSSEGGEISLKAAIFVLVGALVVAGILYLYQVNNIAIQGYEVRDIENKVQDLQQENQKLKIQEVESKSMYNIEKATENLNLVNSGNVSYVEMKGPMAMK